MWIFHGKNILHNFLRQKFMDLNVKEDKWYRTLSQAEGVGKFQRYNIS